MPYNTGKDRGGKNWTRNKYVVGAVVVYLAQIICVEEMCRTRVGDYLSPCCNRWHIDRTSDENEQ